MNITKLMELQVIQLALKSIIFSDAKLRKAATELEEKTELAMDDLINGS